MWHNGAVLEYFRPGLIYTINYTNKKRSKYIFIRKLMGEGHNSATEIVMALVQPLVLIADSLSLPSIQGLVGS